MSQREATITMCMQTVFLQRADRSPLVISPDPRRGRNITFETVNDAEMRQSNWGGGVLLSGGLTQRGKGIRHLNGISQRALIIEEGDGVVMGNIVKITVRGHLEFSLQL